MMSIEILENLKHINSLVIEKLGMYLKESRLRSKIVEVYENYDDFLAKNPNAKSL